MATTASSSVARNVRAELARRKISQQTIAAALGKSQAWIYRRLSDKVSFTIDELDQIAQCIDAPLSKLIEDTPFALAADDEQVAS